MDASISFTSLMDVDDPSQECPQKINPPDLEACLDSSQQNVIQKPKYINQVKYVMDALSSHQQVMKDR
jgi:hypothetical protein